MYLEKLEIQGFKSFAKKTILEFPEKVNSSKGITAIVGPNGSGKSNLSDAIRWVLGEQSIKTLRGKKSQDVIFSGSDKKARLGYAEVSLYLNNHDKKTDIDYEELIITRRVYQSGEGEYFINRNKARLTDIQLLLAKANFGQRTYSIIGQGMADSVLSASLAERKELFDEAVGVKQYQIKRDQALNKFKATRDNLAQSHLTLQELEPRLRSLTRQVKKLEKREEIAKELKQLQLDYFGQIWHKNNKKLKQFAKQKATVEKSHKTYNDEITKIQEQIDQFSTESSRQSQFQKIQSDYNDLIELKNNLLHEKTILGAKVDLQLEKQGQGNVVWLNKRQDEVNKQIESLNEQLKEVNSLIAKEKTSRAEKEDNLTSLEQKLNNVKNELNNLQKTTQLPFEEEKELEEIFNLQQKLVDELLKVTDPEQLNEIKNQARDISQKLSLYLDKLKNYKQKDSADLINLQNQLEDLSQQKNDLTLEISQLQLNLEIKQEKTNSITQEIEKAKQENEKIDKEISLNKIEPKNKKEFYSRINEQLAEIEEKITSIDKKVKAQEEKIGQFNIEEQNKKEHLISLQKEFQEKQLEINSYSQEINQYNIEIAKYTTKLEDLETEIRHDQIELEKIKEHNTEKEVEEETAYQKIEQLKRQMEIIGGIDDETISEYEEIKNRHDFLKEQSDDLEEAIRSLETIIEELDKTIKEQFDKAFKEINKEFQKYFKILFNGGKAELIKVTAAEVKKEEQDEKEEEEEKEEGVLAQADKFAKKIKEKEKESYSGIEIKAVPPGKKIKAINMLSGGERALTAIGLICAIISNNPSPFIVLDEVDAALDEANSERFNLILDELAKKTQFIIISHNRVSMHYAHVLYGVTMGDDGISKMLSVKLADAEDMVGQT
ncbi:chromosome segregation SMC family protein [Patescibacteria group bacterium]